jgi:transposase
MRCSSDLRKRVMAFVKGGGSKEEAAWRFQVSRASVYRWVGAPDGLSYKRPGPKGPRRLDWQALRRQRAQRYDAERAGAVFWCLPALHLACTAEAEIVL